MLLGDGAAGEAIVSFINEAKGMGGLPGLKEYYAD